MSAEGAEGRGEHQGRIGFSVRSCATVRGSVAFRFRKSPFGQTATSPRRLGA